MGFRTTLVYTDCDLANANEEEKRVNEQKINTAAEGSDLLSSAAARGIFHLQRRLRQDYMLHTLLRILSQGLIGGLALLWPALWSLQHFWPDQILWLRVLAGIGLIFLLLIIVRGLRALWQGLHWQALVRQVEQHVPDLGDSLTTSMFLLHSKQPGASQDLVSAQLEQTSRRVLALDVFAQTRRQRWRSSFLLMSFALLTVLAALFIYLRWPEQWQQGWAPLWEQQGELTKTTRLPPLVTDLVLTYRFPAYMHRSEQRVEGSNGEIHAPLGSEVFIQGRTDRPVLGLSLLLGQQELAARVKNGREISVKLPVTAAGHYRFSLQSRDGQRIAPRSHAIVIEVDKTPELQLRAPQDDVVVHQDELLKVAFQARDDFGLNDLFLVVQRRTGETILRRQLEQLDGRLSVLGGETELDISALDVQEGEQLKLYVEASDNDTVSGPKTGRSAQRIIKIFSASEHHQELLAALHSVFLQLVGVLAQDLEHPLKEHLTSKHLRQMMPKAEQREQSFAAAIQSLDKLIKSSADDALASVEIVRALRNARRELSPQAAVEKTLLKLLKASLLGGEAAPTGYLMRLVDNQKQRVRSLERHIIYLDDLYNRERINSAQMASERLRQGQERLADLLQKYQQQGSEALRKEILAEIARLEQQLRDLQRSLAKMRRDISDQYVNREALRAEDMQSPLQRMRQLLAEGKIDEARRELERMRELSKAQQQRMSEASEQFGGEAYSAQRKKLKQLWDQVNDIEQKQRSLMEKNAKQYKQQVEKLRAAMKQDLAKLAKRLAKQARATEKKLGKKAGVHLASFETSELGRSRDRLSEAARALDTQDFASARDSARASAEANKNLQMYLKQRAKVLGGGALGRLKTLRKEQKQAGDEIDKLLMALDKLFPGPQQRSSAAAQKALDEQTKLQRELSKKTARARQSLESLSHDLPVFSPEHAQMLQQAGEKMQRAARKLKGHQRGPALAEQREALSRLSALQQAMQNMGGQGGQGMPLPWASSGEGRGSGDGQGQSKERVEIPNAKDQGAPAAFRRDILDAMKESPPPSYKEQVRRYYEELVK